MRDWAQIIADLNAKGFRYIDLAERCGLNESTISLLRRKVIPEPRHSVGEILLALHVENCVPRETADVVFSSTKK
jgi:lambda repressor-like predicted transcriptional regulator